MDFKIELVPINVSDVDGAVQFYGEKVGWNIDFDETPMEGLRFVQVTPQGSACSFCFGTGLDMLPEGQTQRVQIVVADAEAARDYLRERGIECTDVKDLAWGRFVEFSDPDGNQWSLQQLPQRP